MNCKVIKFGVLKTMYDENDELLHIVVILCNDDMYEQSLWHKCIALYCVGQNVMIMNYLDWV